MRTRLLLLGFLALAGCGSGDPGANDAKPPSTPVDLDQRAAPKPPPLTKAATAVKPAAAAPAVTRVKAAAKSGSAGGKLLRPGPWAPWKKGFQREGNALVCDNGQETNVERGAKQYYLLDQAVPQPVVASGWSKAEGVTGKGGLDYSLYLDIRYADGSFLRSQNAPFSLGTHDWERREVRVVPEKPINWVKLYFFLRRHGGKAWFRGAELRLEEPPDQAELRKELVRQLEDLYKLSKDDRTVAVVDFVDKGPSVELAPLRTALAEMLSSDLAQYEGVRVVERVRVEDFLKEVNLPGGLVDAATAQRARQALAARYLLSETFRGEGKSVSVKVFLHQVGRTEPLARWTLSRPADEVLALRRELVEKIPAARGIPRPVRRGPPPPQDGPSPTLAVLAFRNLSPSRRLDAMENGFADMLQANLGAIKNVRLVERQRLYDVLKEQKLSLSGLVDPRTAVAVGKLLGAQRLIYGSFVEIGDKLRLDVRLADAQTAFVLRSETSEGPTAEFASQLESLAVRLTTALAVRPPADAERLVKAATPARKLEAALHLADGELAYYRGQYDEAAKACERALVVEPKNVKALVCRVRARFAQKEIGAAIEAAEQALASGVLPAGSEAKRQVCKDLAFAYHSASRFDEAADMVKRMKTEFPRLKLLDVHGLGLAALFYVVTPGWEPAAPSLHNTLLSMFGVTADQDMVIRASSTQITEHPITRGIEKAMAKTAVNLRVPEGTALIQADDRVVLAALRYRHGRVVVASFGQWLVPDARTPVAAVEIRTKPRSYTVPRDKLPLEQGAGLELRLLGNVVARLLEPHRDGAPLAAQRQPFLAAHSISLKHQFRTASREAMSAAFEKLIDGAPPGDWKEEALWAAGEATFSVQLVPDGILETPMQGWGRNEAPLFPHHEFYQRLIDQFPDSPLRPWAQWRLAEAKYGQWLADQIPHSQQASLLPWYAKVQADEGTYPWACAAIRSGMLHYMLGDLAKARECFEKVLNRMAPGPEKLLAMLNLARCALADDDKQAAIRYYRMARSHPNILFANTQVGPYENWAPMSERGYVHTTDANQHAHNELRRLGSCSSCAGPWGRPRGDPHPDHHPGDETMPKSCLRCLLAWALVPACLCLAAGPQDAAGPDAAAKRVKVSKNLVKMRGRWEGWGRGFQRDGDVFVCDNGRDTVVHRGAKQSVMLNQVVPQPILASVWSKAEGVTGKPNLDYSLYLDVAFFDGTWLFGQMVPFSVGTHDWERREVIMVPRKPIRAVDFYVLHRRHGGKAWFRDPELYLLKDLQGEAREKELAEQLAQLYTLAKDDRTIAVLDFVDKGPSVELAPLRSALAEMLCGELAQIQGVRVVERMRVGGFLKEVNLPEGLVDAAAAQRAGKALAARYLLGGTFRGEGKQVSVEAQLYEVGRNEPLARWSLSKPAVEVFALEHELAGKALASLGIDKPVRRPPPAARSGPSPNVAVLSLRNLSPSRRLDPMETGFADILQANLGAIPNVRLVDRQRLYDVLKEQKLSLSGLVDPTTATRVGKLLGAGRLVYGSFVEVGDKLRLDVRLADTQTAWVLRSETAEGPTADFAAQLEGLAVRLAAGLAVEPPKEAEQLVKAATPARKVEAALHMARAELAFYRGQFDEAAKASERALLVEPKNAAAMVRRVEARLRQREYGAAIEAGEEALASGALPKKSRVKWQTCLALAEAYHHAMKFDEAAGLIRSMRAEFPGPEADNLAVRELAALFYAGRRAEGVAQLQEAVKRARSRGDAEALAEAVYRLVDYLLFEDQLNMGSLEFERRRDDREYRRKVTNRSRESAETAIRAFDLVLEEAPRHWNAWASLFRKRIFIPLTVRYMGDESWREPYLSNEQKIEYVHRVLKAFSNNPEVVAEAKQRLAKLQGLEEPPEEAMAALERALKQVADCRREKYPYACDVGDYSPAGPLDEAMWARFQMADLRRKRPGGREAAADQMRRIVAEYGLTNTLGASIARALGEMGLEPRIPAKAALIWGGGSRANAAWADVLKPKGLAVHSVLQRGLSAAHLAPYPLVLMVRPGSVALLPAEVLALRHFVATGGSLLVVVTPGWEPASPSLQNALLSTFGVTAEPDMVIRAESTQIAEHPITRGIDRAMAKTAVNLKVPEGTALIRSGDRVVLAALRYRHGRVVVASFGQWVLPDAKTAVGAVRPRSLPPTYSIPLDKLPLEQGRGLELKLLDNVVSWLLEPHREGAPLAAQRKPLIDAQLVALKAQFRTSPRDQMFAAMDKLIASSPAGDWREEALWAAGEVSLNVFYYPDGPLNLPRRGWRGEDKPVLPRPEYFQRLVDEFPNSPLRPWAQWRLAEATLCRLRGKYVPVEDQAPARKLFEKVKAEEGSYPWAWTQLRLGMIHFRLNEFAKARQCFEKVLNRMEPGPEKAMALLDLARCGLATGDRDEAVKCYRIGKSVPNVVFVTTWVGPYVAWGPLSEHGFPMTSSVNQRSRDQLLRMGISQ